MEETIVCKSVFKNGAQSPSGEAITEIWIRLINQTEASKAVLPAAESRREPSK